MQTELIRDQNMRMLCHCIHCGLVVYNKKLCPFCEQTLTESQKHALMINYSVLQTFIQDYILTIKDSTNEFLIIRGGDFEIFKRQVLTLQMWNYMVEHLISGYEDIGVVLTDVFNKKDIYNKQLLNYDKELEKYVLAIIKEKFPNFHINFNSEKDYVSANEMKKYIWRRIAQRESQIDEEYKIINDPDGMRKWVVITDVMKVFNIIRIYSGKEVDKKKVTEVVELLRPPTEKPKSKGQKLLNKIETDFWNFQYELSELFNKLKAMLEKVHFDILATDTIKGECELCKIHKKDAEQVKEQPDK